MKGNKPSRKKKLFPVRQMLKSYLQQAGRWSALPLVYDDMMRYVDSFPLLDREGQDTLWQSVIYSETDRLFLEEALCDIYALLKTDGDRDVLEHLSVARIDYCIFGNTHPFRIRIINKLNDNYDHYYIKKIDASRIYGIELEDILSPNRVTYLVNDSTLIEEHIAGIPGDGFMADYLNVPEFDEIRIAKEFIKFNERCFVRLLGDMRAYNYIVDITPDIEGSQYRIRAIDFDQQSYEGWKSFYLPQYFKENNRVLELGFKHLNPKTVKQYQLEERSLIARRAKMARQRLNRILKCMMEDQISTTEKVDSLKEELGYHHKTDAFRSCENMGSIVLTNLNLVLQKEFKQGIIIQ